jgi:Uma2 family endonuclease
MAATATNPFKQPFAYANEPLYRLSVEQYRELINRGKLTPDDPVELIEGLLLFKSPKGESHIAAARRCRHAIQALVPSGYFYDAQCPITLPDGEPEPDGIVVLGNIDDPETTKPKPDRLCLVIEVADTSLDREHGSKLRSYARAGIGCYWIVNLIDRQIEVYTQPDAVANPPKYQKIDIFKIGESVPFVIDGKSVSAIAVGDILPI